MSVYEAFCELVCLRLSERLPVRMRIRLSYRLCMRLSMRLCGMLSFYGLSVPLKKTCCQAQ